MQFIWDFVALGSLGWLAYLAAMVLVVPVGVLAVAAYACVKASRRQAREREQAGPEAEARRVSEVEAEAPRPRARPSGRARFTIFGWPVDFFEVDGHDGEILAVFNAYTPHSVGYLLAHGERTPDNPDGTECLGMWPHPSRHFGADKIWAFRPEARGNKVWASGEFDLALNAHMWMCREISTAYGAKPEPKPLRGYANLAAANGVDKGAGVVARHIPSSGIEFEMLLADLFSGMGLEVMLTPSSSDYGVDLIVGRFEGDSKIAVQAKYYAGNPVGIGAVQEVFSGKAHYKTGFACVITNSSFTKNAQQLAHETDVALIDNDLLNRLLSGKTEDAKKMFVKIVKSSNLSNY